MKRRSKKRRTRKPAAFKYKGKVILGIKHPVQVRSILNTAKKLTHLEKTVVCNRIK